MRRGLSTRDRQNGELQVVRPEDEGDDDTTEFVLSLIFGGLYALGWHLSAARPAKQGRAGRHSEGVPGRHAVHADDRTDSGVRAQPSADSRRPRSQGKSTARLSVIRGALRFPDGTVSSSQTGQAKEARQARPSSARHRITTVTASRHSASRDDNRGAASDPDAGRSK